jgi:hypothetical protein
VQSDAGIPSPRSGSTPEPPSPDAIWSSICDVPPAADALRHAIPERWVRFYSLPHGKRYADSDDEWQELLRRADTLVSEACAAGAQLMLVTGSHSEAGSEPSRDEVMNAVQPAPEYWRQVLPDDAEAADWPFHLWASWPTYAPHSFDALIRAAAGWKVVGVMLVAVASRIVIHPYDGGTDVFLPTAEERNQWLERHQEWASPLPSGL